MIQPGPSGDGSTAAVARGWARLELEELGRQGLRRELELRSSPQTAVVTMGGRSLVSFSSNDYLGLAADPALVKAAIVGLSEHGLGAGSSRLVVGDTSAHRSLERKLADFKSAEAALLFNSGYAANVGTLQALCGEGDVIFSDALNHASLVDGCRLSRAKVMVYPHNDLEQLERSLSGVSGRRRLVCTESVFSMDGDCAPLTELVAICRRYGAALLVDEAHATGVHGPTGAGLCEALGLESQVDVRVGTLGKALGAFGAFVVSSAEVRELLVNRARSLVFSTALPPSLCTAAKAAIERVEADPELRTKLWRNIGRFSDGLQRCGVSAAASSPIFPLVLGTAERAFQASQELRTLGFLVKPIRPPTVPEGTSRLRFSLSAAHSFEQLDQVLEAIDSLGLARSEG